MSSAVIKLLTNLGGQALAQIIEKPLDIIDRQLAFYNQRQNAEQSAQLRMEEAQFMQKLELENRKLNAELNDLMAERQLERDKKFAETLERYQKTMAECNMSIANSLNNMNTDFRQKAHDLIQLKKREYAKIREEEINMIMNQLDQVISRYPEGSRAREIMEDGISKQINGVFENSMQFMRVVENDFAKMMDTMDQITNHAESNANQYMSLAFARSAAMSSTSIQSNDIKLIK